jgi:hypothetical protein
VRALRGTETERIHGTIREYVSFQLPSNSSSETASSAGALEVIWELGSIVSDRLIDLRLSEHFFGYLL